MNEHHTQEHRDYGFVIGLFTGTVVGAGLAIWLVPRLGSELRERVTGSARRFGQRASEQYQQASTRVVTRSRAHPERSGPRDESPRQWRAGLANWSAIHAAKAIVSLKPRSTRPDRRPSHARIEELAQGRSCAGPWTPFILRAFVRGSTYPGKTRSRRDL